MMIIYIHNASRAHKILPLIEGSNVLVVKGWADLIGIWNLPPDNAVVLIDSFGNYAIKGLILSIVLHAPLVLRIRGEFFREEKEKRKNKSFFGKARSWVSVFLAKVTLRRCKKVICNSNYLAREMKPYLANKTIHVVYNPYTELPASKSVISLRLPDRGFHLITVTNMQYYSKIAPTIDFIQSLDATSFKYNNLYWFICGKGYYLNELKQLVKRKGLENNIFIHDYVENIKPFFVWSDVMIHLTRMDAFPNCTMEAMMHGVPVITNPDSCGTTELVTNDVNGFIGADVLSLIEKYKTDRSLMRQHATNGKKIVENKFSVAVQRDKMRDALIEQ